VPPEANLGQPAFGTGDGMQHDCAPSVNGSHSALNGTVAMEPDHNRLQKASQFYRDRFGAISVPLRARSKCPTLERWQEIRPTSAAEAAAYFTNPALNIGLLLGEASHNLADADLDCAEAIAVASTLLPTTAWKSGRHCLGPARRGGSRGFQSAGRPS
jgi:hypothetical protein